MLLPPLLALQLGKLSTIQWPGRFAYNFFYFVRERIDSKFVVFLKNDNLPPYVTKKVPPFLSRQIEVGENYEAVHVEKTPQCAQERLSLGSDSHIWI